MTDAEKLRRALAPDDEAEFVGDLVKLFDLLRSEVWRLREAVAAERARCVAIVRYAGVMASSVSASDVATRIAERIESGETVT